MSMRTIRAEVRGLLARTNDTIRRTERALAGETGGARVRAAGQLVGLRRRREKLEARRRELDHSPDSVSSTMIHWFKEEWMLVVQSFEAWIDEL